jgi:hypothetical protein
VLLTKKGLQADKARRGMSDAAAAEEEEERTIFAAEAQAAV